jgi:hypothetical protein
MLATPYSTTAGAGKTVAAIEAFHDIVSGGTHRGGHRITEKVFAELNDLWTFRVKRYVIAH